jgi:urease gamma subunit
MIAAIAKDKLQEEDHEHRVKINTLAGEALDTINSKCGEYDKNCDNTKMVKLMGKISNELDNDNVHPGVNHLFNGITINSALKAVHKENEEESDNERHHHHHHHSKK